ncbi:MAG: sodium:solute symporter [Saprospiraceae bacterium]|nr:sodium:solute symporter [Saprospiraceae bacterium]
MVYADSLFFLFSPSGNKSLNISATAILAVIAVYFLVLVLMSWWTSRGTKNENQAFFNANKEAPWYLVAFGMIGASLSGVTFISLPGAVGLEGANQQFSYMQMVFGYLVGYAFIAGVLLPIYYRLKLVSIYSYLEQRLGRSSYKTGAAFFLLSRTIGASFRLYLVAVVMDGIFRASGWDVPFPVTVAGTILLIWIYTFRGGIKTIVWTDTLQTACMLIAVVLSIFAILNNLDMSFGEAWESMKQADLGQWFFFEEGWNDKNNFFKQFLGGAFIAIVMTGLDQDMMQKNLTCRSLGDAQKNMFSFSLVLVVVNFIFLFLGALLYIYLAKNGLDVPTRIVNGEAKAAGDLVYSTVALQELSPAIGLLFIIGLVAAAYSSADSALTSLTTSFCVDFLEFDTNDQQDKDQEQKQKQTRKLVHIGFSILLFLVILAFWLINDSSVINQIFKFAGYTYGPLLGLYAFGLFTYRKVRDNYVPLVCLLAPVLTFVLDYFSATLLFGYKFGFELLLVNGLLTFLGLLIINRTKTSSTDILDETT